MEHATLQLRSLVELVGIEPTTSSLRTMRSAKKPQFGVHLAADYGPKRSNSARLAGSCLKTSLCEIPDAILFLRIPRSGPQPS